MNKLGGTLAAGDLPTSLISLDLGGNDISDLSVLGRLDKLQELRAADNNLSTLKGVERCPKLLEIDVSRNNISILTPLQAVGNLLPT